MAPAEAEEVQLRGVFGSLGQMGDWYDYFDYVYGVDSLIFPIDLGSLHFFYRHKLPARVLHDLRVIDASTECAIQRGDLYTHWSLDYVFRCVTPSCRETRAAQGQLLPRSSSDSLRPYPMNGYPNGTTVEVVHAAGDPP